MTPEETRPVTLRFTDDQYDMMKTKAKQLGLSVTEYIRRLVSNPADFTAGAILAKAVGEDVLPESFINYVIDSVRNHVETCKNWAGKSDAGEWVTRCDDLLKDAWNNQNGEKSEKIYNKLLKLLGDIPEPALAYIDHDVLQLKAAIMNNKIDRRNTIFTPDEVNNQQEGNTETDNELQ